MIYFTLN